MANTKISALTEVTTPETTDVVAIVNDSTTKKITYANLVQGATFNTTTGHDHDGTDSKTVDHANLENKGTNTHTQIDTHIASTSNPHTVTASQVGNGTAQWNASKLQGVDIDTTAPTASQVLAYNSSTSKWTPQSAGTPGAHASTHSAGGSDPIPFVSNNDTYAFKVYLSADVSIPTGVVTKVNFDTEDFDKNSNFDVANYQWTCPADGVYEFRLQTTFYPNATGDRANFIYVDSDLYYLQGQPASAVLNHALNGSLVVTLTAGQVVYSASFQSSGGSLDLYGVDDKANWFSGKYIHA